MSPSRFTKSLFLSGSTQPEFVLLTCIMEAFSAELVLLCVVFVCVAMGIRQGLR